MIPQNNEIPSPVSQAVYLYPDGEVRYKIALHKRNAKNCGSDRTMLQVENKCTTKVKLRVERLDRLRPGWGALAKNRKFTIYAKNTVRRAAGALELEFGKEKLAFTTLTVPGSYHKITKAVASYSGYIMNRIQTYLSDNFSHSDGSKYVLGVVELQDRGMLHWHFLIAVEDTKLIETLEIKMQKFWYRMLKQLSKLSGIDLFRRRKGDTWVNSWERIKKHAVDVQIVKKSVVGYLAKYMSKGCKKEKKSVHKSTGYSPSRWWSCSDDAKTLMHARTLSWVLPKIDWESANEVMGSEVLSSFKAFNMWNSKVINPYTKQLCALVGRGSYELCSEWIRDILPVLMEMCREYDEYNVAFHKAQWSMQWSISREKEEADSDYWAWIALQDYQRKSYERIRNPVKHYKVFWDAIDNDKTIDVAWFKADGYNSQFSPRDVELYEILQKDWNSA